jgi:two-component system sensor histidine kinase KdpD
MLFEIIPVMLTAILSGLILNFFYFTLTLFILQIPRHTTVFDVFYYSLSKCVLTIKIERLKIRHVIKKKKKTIKLYNTLLNSLSHELRTPIATIIWLLTFKENKTNYQKRIKLFYLMRLI